MLELNLNVGTLLIIMVICLILYSYTKCDCSQLEKYQNVYIEPYDNISGPIYIIDNDNNMLYL